MAFGTAPTRTTTSIWRQDWGNKAIINNTESTDLVAEADITLTEVNPGTNGNMA